MGGWDVGVWNGRKEEDEGQESLKETIYKKPETLDPEKTSIRWGETTIRTPLTAIYSIKP